MKSKIPIKEADSADVSLLSGLIRESFRDVAERFGLTPDNCPKHPSNCKDHWIENDFGRGVTYYILVHNGIPQGCVALEKAGPEVCYLERLGVLPGTRRKGFGKALVDHCLLKARTLAVKEISIGIIADDTELKQWYKKMGFVEGETREFSHLPFLVTFMSYDLN
ncbi:MAG: GNAT family N-acetyltransferase [Deltaproteobacteria bacterium]|nr:GNAT family N-acetyltransferase [Deltaproteobacteria bacterium]